MKPIYFFKSVFTAAAVFIAGTANAQMVGTSAFLKGHYVEVGIGHLGYYGSDTMAPAGYHPHLDPTAGMTNLGFVADPDSTNWDTSAAAHYQGDFFYPGSPFEGWELQVNGPRCEAFNSGSGTSGSSSFTFGGGTMTAFGANVSYAASGSTVTSIWQGMIDSIQVKQITTLDTNALYFTVQVVLTNLATTPADNLYYFRTLDPDNDESWSGGSFTTNNLIEHQSVGGIADYSVVSATGTGADHQYLALGTGDTASRAVIYSSWPILPSVDISTVYDETYVGTGAHYTAGAPVPGDIAIGLVINVPHLATVDSAADSVHRTTSIGALHPANSASFKYFYAFSAAAVPAAVIATMQDTAVTTGGSTLAIKNANKATDVKVYPNPARNSISVTSLNTTDNLTLYDMMGRETGQKWSVNVTGTNTFSLTDIPAGNYILVVQDESGNMKARIPLRKQ